MCRSTQVNSRCRNVQKQLDAPPELHSCTTFVCITGRQQTPWPCVTSTPLVLKILIIRCRTQYGTPSPQKGNMVDPKQTSPQARRLREKNLENLLSLIHIQMCIRDSLNIVFRFGNSKILGLQGPKSVPNLKIRKNLCWVSEVIQNFSQNLNLLFGSGNFKIL